LLFPFPFPLPLLFPLSFLSLLSRLAFRNCPQFLAAVIENEGAIVTSFFGIENSGEVLRGEVSSHL